MLGQMNVLFIGQSHRINDPRLRYREMAAIKKRHESAEFYFLQYKKRSLLTDLRFNEGVLVTKENVSGLVVNFLQVVDDRSMLERLLALVSTRCNKSIARWVKRYFADKRVDSIQASDVRELALGLQLQRELRCTCVYDSHEDYVRQALDYGSGSLEAYIGAALFALAEFRFVRRYSSVFCTDEFLVSKYRRSWYGACSVGLLRNFPYFQEQDVIEKKDYRQADQLKLVYIGGVNRFRGVVEAARYVKQFNRVSVGRKLSLTIFSPSNELTKYVVSEFGVEHFEWINYDSLMERLAAYDVGVCLWLPIKKFYRNLPLKNFDYMSIGLPFITSDFGNLRTYVAASGGGLCIDPTSYEAFEVAIDLMFDPEVRSRLGNSGVRWTRREGNFMCESREYLEQFGSLSRTLS